MTLNFKRLSQPSKSIYVRAVLEALSTLAETLSKSIMFKEQGKYMQYVIVV